MDSNAIEAYQVAQAAWIVVCDELVNIAIEGGHTAWVNSFLHAGKGQR